jgi:hypothetical protein
MIGHKRDLRFGTRCLEPRGDVQVSETIDFDICEEQVYVALACEALRFLFVRCAKNMITAAAKKKVRDMT